MDASEWMLMNASEVNKTKSDAQVDGRLHVTYVDMRYYASATTIVVYV